MSSKVWGTTGEKERPVGGWRPVPRLMASHSPVTVTGPRVPQAEVKPLDYGDTVLVLSANLKKKGLP